jgi:hypothetical protein
MRENFRSKMQFNKQITLRLITIFLISQILFCASAKRYVVNRGNDLKDIPILGVEKGIYGSGIITLMPTFPIVDTTNGVGVGIIHGHIGKYKNGDPDNKVIITLSEGPANVTETYFGAIGPNNFYEPINPSSLRTKNKSYKLLVRDRYCGTKIVIYKNVTHQCSYGENVGFLPLEFSIGVYFGFRIGISVGEVLDFVVGFFGFDPMDDDFSYSVYRELPVPISQNKDWESKLDAIDEKMNMRLTK